MKKILWLLLVSICVIPISNAQEVTDAKNRKLPSVEITNLDGQTVNTADFTNGGKPIILSFWATWCKPCVSELTTISEVYEDWKEETGVKLIAVSVDDARTKAGVKPLVDGKAWEYEIYLDGNSDFKRAMNVNLIPHTFVLNGNLDIVWEHTSFSQGAELGLIDVVRKILAGEPVPQP